MKVKIGPHAGDATTPRPAYHRIVMVALSAVVICHAAGFAFQYLSPTPYWDFWNWLADFKSYTEGHYTLSDLIKPHNEHRIVTARLVLFADALYFHMTGLLVVTVNLLLLAAAAALLNILWYPRRRSNLQATASFIVLAGFMVSVCQWQNLIFPFQIQHAFLCFGIAGAAASVTAATRRGLTAGVSATYAAMAGFFIWVAVFSVAGGLLALPWLALQLMVRRASIRVSTIIAASGIAAAILFFHGYNPGHAVPLALPRDLHSLKELLVFASGFIGCPLYPFGSVAYFGGCAGLAAFSAALLLVVFWAATGRGTVTGSMAALAAISGTVALSAAAAAVSRLNIGLAEAIQPRYGTVALLFWVSTAGLVPQVMKAAFPRACARAAYIWPLTILACLALMVLNFTPRYREDARYFSGLLNSQAEAMRQNVYVPQLFKQSFYGSRAEAAARIAFLRQHDLSAFAPGAPAMPAAPVMAALTSRRTLPACEGAIELAYRLDASRIVLRAWLASPGLHRAADWMALLTPSGGVGVTVPMTEYRHKLQLGAGQIRSVLGVYTGVALPPARAGGETNFQAAGLFMGRPDLTCILPQRVSVPSLRIQNLEAIGPLHPIAPAPVPLLAGAFQKDGVTAAAKLPSPGPGIAVFATAKSGDAATGQVRFTFDPGSSDVALPFAVGPDPAGQALTITLQDRATIDLPVPKDTPEATWRVLTLPHEAIAKHGGGPIAIAARDAGTGWGQWLAVAAPAAVTLDPNSAKLY